MKKIIITLSVLLFYWINVEAVGFNAVVKENQNSFKSQTDAKINKDQNRPSIEPEVRNDQGSSQNNQGSSQNNYDRP